MRTPRWFEPIRDLHRADVMWAADRRLTKHPGSWDDRIVRRGAAIVRKMNLEDRAKERHNA